MGFSVESVLIEEAVTTQISEYFVSFSCDTETRAVQCSISDSGGTGIEERPVQKTLIDLSNPKFPECAVPEMILKKLFDIFCANDCLLLEINPLVCAKDIGEWIALDAKIILDDCAMKRHPNLIYSERSFAQGKTPTERELAARKIDADDHRGTAGSSYIDLDGNIGMLPSGGGASLVAMDALFRNGGKPANYTEYSGNPTGEKVKQLVSVVVSKPDLAALWVVGAVANFTDIHETLRGLIEGLRYARTALNLPIDYPIVIRRAGPHDQEAYAMLREVKDFDLHVSGEETSIERSAQQVVQLAQTYHHAKTHTR
jgi:succinyl-CoA synthetase beta subunit